MTTPTYGGPVRGQTLLDIILGLVPQRATDVLGRGRDVGGHGGAGVSGGVLCGQI